MTALDPTVPLLQELIRSRCVNDGAPDSGAESRNADILEDFLRGGGLELERAGELPGRDSVITRIESSDPTAPTLLLMGHTDVVPVSPDGWSRDPFGGDLVDGWVWGRGAIDMLNLTAGMAVATRRLADSGWRPRGTLIFLGVADEEAGGSHGAGWLVDQRRDHVRADYVITESGGVPVDTAAGQRLWVTVGEKGTAWSTLIVHGTPGHGSRPHGADNALVKAAQVVSRLAQSRGTVRIDDFWRRFVEGMAFPEDLAAALVDPDRVDEAIERLPAGMASRAHASTRMTVSPTVCHGGSKTNVIPDRVELQIDVRTLPQQSRATLERHLDEVLGELRPSVELRVTHEAAASISPVDTPLWEAIVSASRRLMPEATCVPALTTGGTDARFFREIGVPAYGWGLYSRRISVDQWSAMFHGNDERVDVQSLELTAAVYEHVARELLS